MFKIVATAAVFILTYGGVAAGRVPGLRIDRAGIALTGAALMMAIGAITPDEAYRAVDLDTIALLIGMMIVVGHLRLSGFFRLAAGHALGYAHSPAVFLVAVSAITAVLSAFLVNDAVCLVMAPLVLQMTRALKREPAPYLLAVAMASNAGSVATITGNPQNMIIGATAHIPYGEFAARLWPIAFFALVASAAAVALGYRGEFLARARFSAEPVKTHVNRPQTIKALAVTVLVVAMFFLGVPVGEAAILGGAVLLVTRSIKAEKVHREIDGTLLLIFGGLFIVVAGAEKVLLNPDLVAAVRDVGLSNVWRLTATTAALSNIVSNVPAVLMLKPFVAGLADEKRLWLVIAMSSTLAGNFTIVGSVANIIVAERARQAGVAISFWDYARIGTPMTLVTLAFGAWWMS
jgi:Na+/H+ antiporter NhaD/arsenite permease-like protein